MSWNYSPIFQGHMSSLHQWTGLSAVPLIIYPIFPAKPWYQKILINTFQSIQNIKDYPWDYSGYGLRQWEKALLCNTSPHWLIPYPVWSLYFHPSRQVDHYPPKDCPAALRAALSPGPRCAHHQQTQDCLHHWSLGPGHTTALAIYGRLPTRGTYRCRGRRGCQHSQGLCTESGVSGSCAVAWFKSFLAESFWRNIDIDMCFWLIGPWEIRMKF